MHVKIPEDIPYRAYETPSAQSVFAVPFPFFAPTDIRVWVGGVEAVRVDAPDSPGSSAEFSIVGAPQDGGFSSGTVTLGAPVQGVVVVVVRDTPLERLSDFPYPSDVLNIRTLNGELDKIWATLQQERAASNRAVRVPLQDRPIPELPPVTERAGKVLGFDPLGDPAVSEIDLDDLGNVAELVEEAREARDEAVAARLAAAASAAASQAASEVAVDAAQEAVEAAASIETIGTAFFPRLRLGLWDRLAYVITDEAGYVLGGTTTAGGAYVPAPDPSSVPLPVLIPLTARELRQAHSIEVDAAGHVLRYVIGSDLPDKPVTLASTPVLVPLEARALRRADRLDVDAEGHVLGSVTVRAPAERASQPILLPLMARQARRSPVVIIDATGFIHADAEILAVAVPLAVRELRTAQALDVTAEGHVIAFSGRDGHYVDYRQWAFPAGIDGVTSAATNTQGDPIRVDSLDPTQAVAVGVGGEYTVSAAPYEFRSAHPYVGGASFRGALTRPSLGALTRVAFDRGGDLYMPDAPELIMLLPIYGQSLSVGSNGVPPLWINTWRDWLLMPSTGQATDDIRLGLPASAGPPGTLLDPQTIIGFRPLEAKAGWQSTTYGQTPAETCLDTLHRLGRDRLHLPTRWCAIAPGVGGATIAELSSGTNPFVNAAAATGRLVELAAAQGRHVWVPGVLWDQGESNQTTPIATYLSALAQLQADLETALQAHTAQASAIPLFMSQPSSFGKGVANATLAILQAHEDTPDTHILVGAKYHLDYDIGGPGPGDDDNVHLSERGYWLDGEYKAKAIAATAFGLSRWQPLSPIRAGVSRTGADIDIPMHVPVPPLVIDTTTISERSGTVAGFVAVDTVTSAVLPIDTVTLADATTVRLTLAFSPSNPVRVEYALEGHVTFPRIEAERPRGNLRDSDLTPSSLDGRPLYNWCVHFNLEVL